MACQTSLYWAISVCLLGIVRDYGDLEMNFYQYAKHDCANCRPDGSCLGISEHDLNDPKFAAELDKCKLAESPIKPCDYFEHLVLPLADQPGPKDTPQLQSQRLDARQAYLMKTKRPVLGAVVRACPECGATIAPRRRLCEKCSQKRRRASSRDRARKYRKLVV